MALQERREELAILIQAIDELGKMGEVKVTEWVRRGQIVWIEKECMWKKPTKSF